MKHYAWAPIAIAVIGLLFTAYHLKSGVYRGKTVRIVRAKSPVAFWIFIVTNIAGCLGLIAYTFYLLK